MCFVVFAGPAEDPRVRNWDPRGTRGTRAGPAQAFCDVFRIDVARNWDPRGTRAGPAQAFCYFGTRVGPAQDWSRMRAFETGTFVKTEEPAQDPRRHANGRMVRNQYTVASSNFDVAAEIRV